MKTYAVKQVFRTIQGEGYHAGTPATFVRLVGCNMWSGREEDRARDADRTGAQCPKWCDTDFVGGDRMAAPDIVAAVRRASDPRLVVISGGEPMLQVDLGLLEELAHAFPGATIAIETNGTVCPSWYPPGPTADMIGSAGRYVPRPWITLSPKLGRRGTVLPWADELKVVWPAYSEIEWEGFAAMHFFVQPLAWVDRLNPQLEASAASGIAHGGFGPTWRLSLQTHKHVGVP